MDYLEPQLSEEELKNISVLGLAHTGDAVYEILVRAYLVSQHHTSSLDLHKSTVSLVNAPAQAAAFEKIEPMLTDEEKAVYKRGRNAKVNSVPKNASQAQYHSATGLEALFGYLYLSGRRERISTLFEEII